MLYSDTTLLFIASDFLLIGWVNPTPKLINDEIRATNHRLEIDNDDFTFTFTQELSEEFSKKLSSNDYYEDVEYAEKDFKKRVAEQRKLVFKTRKDQGGSLGDDEFNIIHGNSNSSPFQINLNQNPSPPLENEDQSMILLITFIEEDSK